ncbi:metallophosphoesterase [candidate division WOR-1 bacterium RIFCSPLOWO2_02_FULL_46_20]|uniref:Metallophosphoesterase n=2 Tax=Saganbacteria TaxID=1703751 RepID=A0A1F4RD19_UNCSA|nr:MAG: metallophosphoesterase [candidate division WOR-1 bacterium RIFCSPHIGHO2_02_FULL_45_12]OGC06069.1 MAG: metallophosphoesterase [candidate division WOR-1 bacterium RIFCSPLOWO2_02_FULL_46_20]OGC09248.1 MAG: metallophosphoesterase [candidate division WOR-1 bacterium RIFCSPLOWO2_12_FULL_45_9]
MKVLFIGDIIGKLGRQVCRQVLPELKRELAPDLIIANGENSAHGYGITEIVYNELLGMGVGAITMGNHVWDKKELIQKKIIDKLPLVIRPANYPPGVPGQDHLIVEKNGARIAITNLSGRTFMKSLDCPFQTIDKLLPSFKTNVVIVDMHAEATSEKCALAWHLSGRVSAVLGTHTHVMTADERILPDGTAFISDAGMCGAYESIIGMNREAIIKRFLTQIPEKFEPTESGTGLFNAVFLKIDPISGHTKEIKRIQKATN